MCTIIGVGERLHKVLGQIGSLRLAIVSVWATCSHFPPFFSIFDYIFLKLHNKKFRVRAKTLMGLGNQKCTYNFFGLTWKLILWWASLNSSHIKKQAYMLSFETSIGKYLHWKLVTSYCLLVSTITWLVTFWRIYQVRYSIGSVSAWHASGPEFDPHVRHILLWRLGPEKISTAILPLLLIQEEQLSVTSKRLCTKYW